MNWTSIETWAMTPGGIAVWLTLLCGLFFMLGSFGSNRHHSSKKTLGSK